MNNIDKNLFTGYDTLTYGAPILLSYSYGAPIEELIAVQNLISMRTKI